jgi:hypothetical protein
MPRAKKTSTPKSKTVISTVPATTNGNGHSPEVVDMEVQIRIRAYELYAQRGFTTGDERQDWLLAEQEVKAKHATAGA